MEVLFLCFFASDRCTECLSPLPSPLNMSTHFLDSIDDAFIGVALLYFMPSERT